jgi:hypothetical protein
LPREGCIDWPTAELACLREVVALEPKLSMSEAPLLAV